MHYLYFHFVSICKQLSSNSESPDTTIICNSVKLNMLNSKEETQIHPEKMIRMGHTAQIQYNKAVLLW